MQQYRISVPEVDEQDKISTFMNKINQIIALHERRLGQLNNLKQAFLQKLYV
ncbi:restriction endonuclease subunit S domain-containing protein [Furfurilactobacillus rossiae]|uniref:hypothetical protein n=1 Tax=Furfurilactobacillus rossiae TaxID=231049 RepID=UPI0009D9D387|nr:hypothetical protein LR814_09885 [Furfurilactobacillus rossiae]